MNRPLRILVVLALGVTLATNACAQSVIKADSLILIYRTNPGDTSAALQVIRLAGQLYHTKPDSAIRLATTIAELTSTNGYDKGSARAYRNLGLAYWIKGDNFDALESFYKAKDYYQATNDLSGVAASLNNIGLIHYYQAEYDPALKNFQEALLIDEQRHDTLNIATVMNNVGLAHEGLGHMPVALDLYERALVLALKEGDPGVIGQSRTNLGFLHFALNNLDLAESNLTAAVDIQKKNEDFSTLTSSYAALAKIWLKRKNFSRAADFGHLSLGAARRVKFTYDGREASEVLYQIYREWKDYPKALEYFQLYKIYNDSLLTAEKSKALVNLETKIALTAKQKEVEALELERSQQRKITIVVVTGLIIVLLFAFFLMRSRIQLKAAYKKLEFAHDDLRDAKNELEMQAEMLRKSNQSKDKIFSIVSHDLRSPLNSLNSLFVLLENNQLTIEEFRQLVPDLNKRLKHASSITDELLRWSRHQLSSLEVRPVLFTIATEFNAKIDRMRQAAEEKGIQLEVKPGEDCTVYADPDMVRTTLRNLISNAIKFTNQGGIITLSAASVGDKAIIQITDNGVGIAPERLGKIFESEGFSSPGTAGERGTGLGLALSKEFILKNHGTITVESTPGNGSCFTITLPGRQP